VAVPVSDETWRGAPSPDGQGGYLVPVMSRVKIAGGGPFGAIESVEHYVETKPGVWMLLRTDRP